MELKEDIEKLQTLISKYKEIEKSNNNDHKLVLTVGYEELKAIDTVLEELNNRIPKDDLKNILRKVQDYQLNYKDTVLFNIIMQEIFGETEWTNLEDKE